MTQKKLSESDKFELWLLQRMIKRNELDIKILEAILWLLLSLGCILALALGYYLSGLVSIIFKLF